MAIWRPSAWLTPYFIREWDIECFFVLLINTVGHSFLTERTTNKIYAREQNIQCVLFHKIKAVSQVYCQSAGYADYQKKMHSLKHTLAKTFKYPNRSERKRKRLCTARSILTFNMIIITQIHWRLIVIFLLLLHLILYFRAFVSFTVRLSVWVCVCV